MIIGNVLTVKTDHIEAIISKDEVIGLLKQKRITELENTVIISISDPEYIEDSRAPIQEKYLRQFDKFLRVKFFDEVSESYLSDDGIEVYPIEQKELDLIVGFIKQNKDKKFIINCNAGVSRSAGIGLLVSAILGNFDDKYHFKTSFDDVISEHYRYSPNLTPLDKFYQ